MRGQIEVSVMRAEAIDITIRPNVLHKPYNGV